MATAQALDMEMEERIANHRQERGDEFLTLEEPLALSQAIMQAKDCDVVLIDCITLWISNALGAQWSSPKVLEEVDAFLSAAKERRFHTLMVTNEVGLGMVPMNSLGRAFRDLSGLISQRISQESDEVYLAILGNILRIRPGPVETLS